jgi:hypothetical protein
MYASMSVRDAAPNFIFISCDCDDYPGLGVAMDVGGGESVMFHVHAFS